MKKLLIVDAFGLIFRAYYALIKRPLSTREGFPTSAIFGFWKMLFKSIKDIEPDEVIIALDSPGPSFRKEMYPAYKANREEAPEDLKEQIAYIVTMLERLKVPHLRQDGLEADDIIAFLAQKYKRESKRIYILSSDKDLAQLVDEQVVLAAPEKGIAELRILDVAGVVEKFGVRPSQILDYLALIGDTSDNIPGVKGIGPKTAVGLLESYGNLQEIYEHLEEIKSESVRKKLSEGKEAAFLSLELVRLKTDLENLPDFMPGKVVHSENWTLLEAEFLKLEFKNLVNEEIFIRAKPTKEFSLFATGTSDKKESASPEDLTENRIQRGNYQLVLSKNEFAGLEQRIRSQGIFALDTETDSLNPRKASIIGFSLALKAGEAFYFPLFEGAGCDYTKAEFFEWMKVLLEEKSIRKVGQNIKYDWQILFPYATVRGVYFDTMLAAYVLEPDAKKYGMDYLAQKYLNYRTIAFDELVNAKKGETLLDVPLSQVKDYACEDADITWRLYELFAPLLESEKVSETFYQVEMPLVPVLAKMELSGIGFDVHYLRQIQSELEDTLSGLEDKIYLEAGGKFNLNSPLQVGEVLFEKLGLPALKKTKTGYSTDEGVLEQLSHQHPVPGFLLDYRKYSKLLNTYVNGLPKHLEGGRIYTSFHQAGTATGRLSSSEPNLQNIPIKDEAGRKIRRAFVAPPGKTLISADYSQIELRIMAHFSKDMNLIEAFAEGVDIHKRTASLIFGVAESAVTDTQRTVAKTINFGIIYGMGAFRLSGELGISMGEAKAFINRYFHVFAGVQDYIETVKENARKDEAVRTLLGHRRKLPYINSSNRNLRESDERMAVNTIIQGTNAEIMKLVMNRLDGLLPGTGARALLQIHDELIFEVDSPQSYAFSMILREQMENILTLRVPLLVSIHQAANWGDLK